MTHPDGDPDADDPGACEAGAGEDPVAPMLNDDAGDDFGDLLEDGLDDGDTDLEDD